MTKCHDILYFMQYLFGEMWENIEKSTVFDVIMAGLGPTWLTCALYTYYPQLNVSVTVYHFSVIVFTPILGQE